MKGRVTKTGYRRNSPDVNNDYNIIPSNRISMIGVDFPVLGIDNLGNSELMYPGSEYEFQGDYVTELPAYGSGGLTQWFAEEWVDVKTGKKCGRSGKDKNGRPYPACRPSKRVNKTTPKTTKEMSSAEKAKFKKSKTSSKRINYNHKRAQEGIEVVGRNGVRKNEDNSVSTHLMAREYVDGRGWVAFPTLFQNEDNTWIDMSQDSSFYPAYEEALKRGEVYDFGENVKAAIKFADEGSWKKEKYQTGRQVGPPSLTPGPIQDKVYPMVTGPVEDSLENRIVNAKSSKPKSNVLDLDNTLDYLVDSRGNTKDFWGNTADTIAYHESWHTMNPKMKQADDGPARGMFQFEGPAFKTFQNRYKTVANALELEVDEDILKATSADQLTPKQQYTAFLVNLIESDAVLKDYADGKTSIEDLWLTGHKNVEAKGDRKSFRTSVDKSKVKGIKGGYAELKKQGGQSLPDYSKYDTQERAWFAARKELGKGKVFMYGGEKHYTYTPKGL